MYIDNIYIYIVFKHINIYIYIFIAYCLLVLHQAFHAVAEAFEALSWPVRRAAYEAELRGAPWAAGNRHWAQEGINSKGDVANPM